MPALQIQVKTIENGPPARLPAQATQPQREHGARLRHSGASPTGGPRMQRPLRIRMTASKHHTQRNSQGQVTLLVSRAMAVVMVRVERSMLPG